MDTYVPLVSGIRIGIELAMSTSTVIEVFLERYIV